MAQRSSSVLDGGVALTANPDFAATIDRFDRVLARQLAARIAQGIRCDAPTVRQCYIEARRELNLIPSECDGTGFQDVETRFVQNVAHLVQDYRPDPAQITESVMEMEAQIALLLRGVHDRGGALDESSEACNAVRRVALGKQLTH